MEIEEAKSLKDCYECATIDAYGEDEIAAGWFECLNHVLDDIDDCQCLGETVGFNGLVQKGAATLASISKSKKKAFVSLDSINWVY